MQKFLGRIMGVNQVCDIRSGKYASWIIRMNVLWLLLIFGIRMKYAVDATRF